MTEIWVLDRYGAERTYRNALAYGPNPPSQFYTTMWISVIDPESETFLPEGDNVLTLKFDDITREYPDRPGRPLILFNEDRARKVKEFLDKVGDKMLIVHCTAGICRSGAIGRFACEYLERDREQFDRTNKQINPNVHVLSMLRRLYKPIVGGRC